MEHAGLVHGFATGDPNFPPCLSITCECGNELYVELGRSEMCDGSDDDKKPCRRVWVAHETIHNDKIVVRLRRVS